MRKQLVILDGGMGRELKRMGAPFSQPLWSAQALIESPKLVRQAHQNFVDAGAQILTVNSYACVPFHLGEELYQSSGADLAKQAALIANEVASSSSLQLEREIAVAGCIPPVLGSYRPDLFEASKASAIIQTLIHAQEPYIDLWMAETISSLEEFDAIQAALKGSFKKKYYAFTLQDSNENGVKLRSGQLVEEAVSRVCAAQAEGILFNCSIPEVMAQAIVIAKQLSVKLGFDLEIGAYANSFGPIQTGHLANNSLKKITNLSPQQYLVFAQQWYELGASIIGGCCGIHPEHIQAIDDWRHQLK